DHYLLLFLPFTAPAPSSSSPLSLHDALPISFIFASSSSTCDFDASAPSSRSSWVWSDVKSSSAPEVVSSSIADARACICSVLSRSEEHTSELQSRFDLVCRLLLEKKKKYRYY